MFKTYHRIYDFLSRKLKTIFKIYLKFHVNPKLRPNISAFKISTIFCVIGVLWIALSSGIINLLTNNTSTILLIELLKGWILVIITAIFIYTVVRKILIRHETTRLRLHKNIVDLKKTHKELIILKEDLSILAYTDTLTKLPNKISLENNINQLISFHEQEKVRFAVLCLDIDNFKNINNIMGNSAGDLFLTEFAKILKQSISDTDFAARLHGDGFAVIIHYTNSIDKIYTTLDILKERLRKTWVINDHEFLITFSIGVTIFPDDGITSSALMRNAETAMYSIKKTSKDSFSFYTKEILEQNLKKIDMTTSLRRAIKNQEFKLVFQPIKHLATNKIIATEALIRWHHPHRGIIPPMEFIPLAEENGLINEIDMWVIESAFKQKKEWAEKGFDNIRMNVNVSGVSLRREGLVEDIKNLLIKTGTNPHEIMIEVTETVLIENIETSVEILKRIKNMGIRIALDDFGTGYSSLTYLEKLPIDVVKLDRSFVQDIVKQNQVSIIVENIIRLTHDLLLEITAEGIENPKQIDYLKSNLCDYGQGYYFSKPVDNYVLEGML